MTPDTNVDDANRPRYDASKWLSLDESSFVLQAGETKTVTLTISAPPTAEPGGHYATVRFLSVPNVSQTPASPVGVTGSVGLLVFTTITGDIRQDVSPVGKIQVEQIQTSGDITKLRLRMRNQGNVHVPLIGSVTLTNWRDDQVGEVPIPQGLLLPGTERTYQMDWKHGTKIGPYEATASFTAGTSNKPYVVKSDRFYLVPLIIVLPVAFLFSIVVLILIAKQLNKRRKRKPAKAGDQSSQERQR